jgi:bifunctional DNA-binding transcriptional regulator/antitoxin component of YhaV-PrlF toxin-antitoxin module
MHAVVSMDKTGRIVIPGPMRKALNISRSVEFKAELIGNKVELTVIGPQRRALLKRRRGLLTVSTGGRKFDAVAAIDAMREERY